MSEACLHIKDPGLGGCCCTCCYLQPVAERGEQFVPDPNKLACLAPEFGHIVVGWSEHGLCEMYVDKRTPHDERWVRIKRSYYERLRAAFDNR